MNVQTLKRRFTVDEFHRMGETGVLTEDDSVELWVINLSEGHVEVYRQPPGGEYGEHVALGRGSALRLPGLGSLQVAVDDVLA